VGLNPSSDGQKKMVNFFEQEVRNCVFSSEAGSRADGSQPRCS